MEQVHERQVDGSAISKNQGLVFLEKKMLVLFSVSQDLSLPIADIHQPLKYSLGGAHVHEVK